MKYLTLIKLSIKKQYVYKPALLISFLIGNVNLLVAFFLWKAILANTNVHLQDTTLTYVVIALILRQFIESFGLEWQVSEDVRLGKMVNLLQHPFSYADYLISIVIGEKIANFILRMPLLILFLFIIKSELKFPGLVNFYLFFMTGIVAFFIYSLITIVIGLLSFWFIEVSGFFYLSNLVNIICSGALIPIYLMPDSIIFFLKFLPFYYLIYFPVCIFIDSLNSSEIITGVLIQFFWLIVLYYFCAYVSKKAFRVYENFGG